VFVTSGSQYEFLRFRTFDEQCTRTFEGYSNVPVCGWYDNSVDDCQVGFATVRSVLEVLRQHNFPSKLSK
jgi:hypothetical protein